MEFCMKKCLRQGDPLAHFLFLVVAEGLGGLMREAVNKSLFSGYKMGRGNVMVSHVQYADDTLLIGEVSEKNILVMKSVLRWFELVSGLKINFFKSKLAVIGGNDLLLERFAHILNCKSMKAPFTYLGIEVGANPRRRSTWLKVLERIKKKLTPWKMKNLSFGGRICLLNSVISSLPLFSISFFKLPISIANEIRKLHSHFLWGGSGEGRKIHWVCWEKVCKPKVCGGLGVKDILKFNRALLGKWRWRVLSQDRGLWWRVLNDKYGGVDVLGSERSFLKGSNWWVDIGRVASGEGEGRWFEVGIGKKIGSGCSVSFWEDKWVGEVTFKEKFQRLYEMSNQKGMMVAELGEWVGNEWKWKFEWRRALFMWELPLFDAFLQVTENIHLKQGIMDSWCWKYDVDNGYTVKEAYKAQLKPVGIQDKEIFSRI